MMILVIILLDCLLRGLTERFNWEVQLEGLNGGSTTLQWSTMQHLFLWNWFAIAGYRWLLRILIAVYLMYIGWGKFGCLQFDAALTLFSRHCLVNRLDCWRSLWFRECKAPKTFKNLSLLHVVKFGKTRTITTTTNARVVIRNCSLSLLNGWDSLLLVWWIAG